MECVEKADLLHQDWSNYTKFFVDEKNVVVVSRNNVNGSALIDENFKIFRVNFGEQNYELKSQEILNFISNLSKTRVESMWVDLRSEMMKLQNF